jgi:hypothetical protein
MQTREKLVLILFVQALVNIFVVIEHSFLLFPDVNFHWMTAFTMPTFVFVSGFLMRYTTLRKGLDPLTMPLWGRKGYLTRKVRRLLVPYVVISSLVFIPKALFISAGVQTVHSNQLTLTDYIHNLVYPLDNVIAPYWFLPMVFLVFVIATYIPRLLARIYTPKRGTAAILITLTLIFAVWRPFNEITFLAIRRACYFIFYFTVGYYFCQYRMDKPISRHACSLFIVTLIISILQLYIPYFLGKDIIIGINGILMLIALGELYIRYDLHMLHPVFGASYMIYLLSWFPNVAAQQILSSISNTPPIICSILSLTFGVLIPLGIYRLLERYSDRKLCQLIRPIFGM